MSRGEGGRESEKITPLCPSIHSSIHSSIFQRDGIGSELGNYLRFEFNALQTVARI